MRKGLVIIVCLAFIVCWAGCGEMAKKKTAEKPAETGKTVATVNNAKITEDQVNKLLEGMRDPRQLAKFSTPDGKKELVNKLVDMELIDAAARKDGMLNDPEVSQLIKNYTKQVLFVSYLQKKMKDQAQQADEAKAREYYDSHPQEFQQGEQIKAQHILIKVAADADDKAVAAAKQKATDLYKKIKGGADFAKLAKENSDDPGTKAKGGELGFFSRGQMVPEFDEVAFGLKDGEVSQPVKTKFGWHVIKVLERKETGATPFEQAKERLIRKLSFQSQQDAYDKILGELRKTAKITVNDEAVQSINIPTPQMGMPGMSGMPPGMTGAQPQVP